MSQIMIRICLVLLLVFPSIPVFADDSLMDDMEIEIRIQNLSDKTYRWARNKAWETAKKTTLGQQWLAANKKDIEALQKSINIGKEWQRVFDAQRQYEREFERNWYRQRKRGWWLTAIQQDATYQEFEKEKKALDVERKSASRDYRKSESRHLYDKLDRLADKFAWKLYRQEMEKRLNELEIEITKDVLKKIEKSYKFHRA